MTDNFDGQSIGTGWWLGLFLLAFLLRVGAIFYLGVPDAPDTPSYTIPAMNLAEGLGYVAHQGEPYLYRPPTYPFFLAGLFWLFGKSLFTVQVSQAVLAALVSPLIGALSARSFASAPAGRMAGLLWAVDPVAVPVPAFILTEALGGFLVIVVLYLTYSGLEKGSARLMALAGISAAALALNTPITLLFFPALLMVGALAVRGKKKGWARSSVLGLVCFALVFGAWPARNYLATGEPVMVRSIGFGSLLWRSTQLEFDWLPSPYEDDYQRVEEKFQEITEKVPEKEQHSHFMNLAWQNFKKEPLTVIKRLAKANFWFWVEVPGAMRLLQGKPLIRWPMTAFHDLMLVCFAVGLIFGLRSRFHAVALPAAAAGYFALMLIPMMPIPRYYLPVWPVVVAFSGPGVLRFFRRGRA